MHNLPDGAWPVMLTPFLSDLSIDWDAVDASADWLIRHGAAGIFTVALSSEMYDLSPQERVDLARSVVKKADGRVPVIASALGDDVAEVAASAKGLLEAGASGIVLAVSTLVGPEEPDEAFVSRVETLLELVADAPFGIYECPVPYKRLLTLPTVQWLAETGRFHFFKDTSHQVDVMSARIHASRGTPMKLYNAEISSLTATLRAGGHGFSGYAANIYPDLVAWLCSHHSDADPSEVERVQRLLSIAEHAVNNRYPTSAKHLLAYRSGLEFEAISRWKPATIGSHEGQPLNDLVDFIASLDLAGLR